MRLDGILSLLSFLLLLTCGLLVDVALLIRAFRYRVVVVAACALAAAAVLLFLYAVASPGERAMFAKVLHGGAWRVVLAVIGVVLVPFLFVAPVAQYLALQDGRASPRWIAAGMLLQLVFLPAFVVLAFTNDHYWERERAAGREEGVRIRPGELAALSARAAEKRERIWGTGWYYPWPQKAAVESPGGHSGWIVGLAQGVDHSELIGADEPLGPPDAAALKTLLDQHFAGLAGQRIRAKLLWDALEPGRFARQLAPSGVRENNTVDEEVLAVLLERLEKYAPARLCPGGTMMEADRAVLRALVEAKGPVWSVDQRQHLIRPEWATHRERVERLCRGRG